MKCLTYTTALTLVLFSVVTADKATATSTEYSSETSEITPISKPLNSTSSENPLQVKPTSSQQVQSSYGEEAAPESRTTHSKRGYPAYCDSYLLNAIPGSWQFEQDVQRCIHGGG
jgi:hypothetical protein